MATERKSDVKCLDCGRTFRPRGLASHRRSKHANSPATPTPIDELADLRADYVRLGRSMEFARGSELAALARERRMMRVRLNELEDASEGTMIDEVAARRESKATAPRPPARRRQSR